MLITSLYASGLLTSDTTPIARAVALVAGVLASLGYSVSRGLVKKA